MKFDIGSFDTDGAGGLAAVVPGGAGGLLFHPGGVGGLFVPSWHYPHSDFWIGYTFLFLYIDFLC
ncbi:hypothetical protein HanIR_Chr04g0169541 [Helianthus annuus]|nr:hypothetical protein HanIR_Chr04g0169541 [Helianthus annuus]